MGTNVVTDVQPPLSAEVQALVNSGAIKTKMSTVDIAAKVSPTGQALSAPVTLLEFTNAEGALAYEGGKEEEIWARYSAAVNLDRRQKVRTNLLIENRGPEFEYLGRARQYAEDVANGRKIPKFLRGLSVEKMAEALWAQAQEDDDEA